MELSLFGLACLAACVLSFKALRIASYLVLQSIFFLVVKREEYQDMLPC
jgi:hypothetical protein